MQHKSVDHQREDIEEQLYRKSVEVQGLCQEGFNKAKFSLTYFHNFSLADKATIYCPPTGESEE